MRLLIYLFLVIGLISCVPEEKKLNSDEIQIHWVSNLDEDFSFKNEWSYPEGVYRNEFGQLSCDGFCSSEIDKMKDYKGRIFEDSLESFYKLVDTTHLFHSIKSVAWAYEWAGTNYISVKRISKDTVHCLTQSNIATHSVLNLIIVKDIVKPTIVLSSIVDSTGVKIYKSKSGKMIIDQNLYNKGILKASFDFKFDHIDNPDKPMYWKGKIYSPVALVSTSPSISLRKNHLF